MRALTEQEYIFLSTHIAKGLEQLGIDVTPRTMEAGHQQLYAMTAGGPPSQYSPPDPYARALCQMKKEQR
jgi:hypothetical protein